MYYIQEQSTEDPKLVLQFLLHVKDAELHECGRGFGVKLPPAARVEQRIKGRGGSDAVPEDLTSVEVALRLRGGAAEQHAWATALRNAACAAPGSLLASREEIAQVQGQAQGQGAAFGAPTTAKKSTKALAAEKENSPRPPSLDATRLLLFSPLGLTKRSDAGAEGEWPSPGRG